MSAPASNRPLTEAQRKALTWIREREPVGAFTADAPRLSFVAKLLAVGLVERAGVEPGMFGFVLYRLTPAGRAALTPTPEPTDDH